MTFDGVIAISERSIVSPFYCFGKRCLQALGCCQEVESFSVLRLNFKTCLCQSLRLASQPAKLVNNLWIDFIVSVCVERLGVVKAGLQTSRLKECLGPQMRREQLVTGGMVWQ